MPSSALPNWKTATQFSNPMSRPSLASMVADLDVTVTIVDNSEDEEDSSQLCAAPEVGKRQNSEQIEMLKMMFIDASSTPDRAQPVDEHMLIRRRDLKAQMKAEDKVDLSSDDKVDLIGRAGDRYWTEPEHERFIEAVRRFGKNWGQITRYVGSRSRQSVYSHAQKFRKRIEKEPYLKGAECAQILAKLDQQFYGQSSIMRARICDIEAI